jgi:Ulp1 family protease
LVDNLFDRAAQEHHSEEIERVTRPVPNGLPTQKSIREVLGELKPPRRTGLIRQQDQNSHLRRSTTRASDDIWAHLEDVPVEEKYSKVHGLGKAWSKPLTYPREGRKKTTVEFSDLERLDEGEFLNDNLISFYLRFLEQELGDRRPDVAKRVYFFNTYFYATLTNTHKGKKCFNYEGVQKWTRTVDLFTYDYIIVPINESSHWYLAVVCNLPALDRDLEAPGDAASSQAEIDRTAAGDEFNEFAPPSSSPAIPEHAGEGSVALVEDAEDETAARNSFAEMSLDNGVKRFAHHADTGKVRHAEAVDPEAEDQEMLDAQLKDDLLGSVAPKTDDIHFGAKAAWLTSLAQQQVQDAEDPVEDEDDNPKTSTGKSKKQKRKSVPPAVTKTDPNKPAIILFDSLGLSRGPTIKTLKEYLLAEARTKRGGMRFDGGQIKGINAKVPLQTNFSDCGLFLLGYVAKFLEDDPRDFIANIIGRTYETKDWSKLAPSTLRASIRDQVQELHRVQDEERQSTRKAGKFQDKNDSKSESSPTRGPVGQAKTLGLDPVASGADPLRTPVELPKADLPEPGQDELDAKLSRPEGDFDKRRAQVTLTSSAIDDNETQKSFQETDKAIEAAAAEISPPRARNSPVVGQDEGQKGRWTQAGTIVLDSQSQRDPSTHESLELVVQETRPRSRLPSEIPDSQPSAPATWGHSEPPPRESASPPRSEAMKSFEKILGKQGLQRSTTRAQDATSGEAHKVTVEIPIERPEKQNDRSRRRRSTRINLEKDGLQVIDVIDVDDQ